VKAAREKNDRDGFSHRSHRAPGFYQIIALRFLNELIESELFDTRKAHITGADATSVA